MSDLTVREALRILQVPPTATSDEIRIAWRNRLHAVHPDRNPGSAEVARQQFDQVQNAYQKLTEPSVVKLRNLAYANGPSAPFVPGELEAFRLLGLGPSATYDEIDQRVAELILSGSKAGDFRRAQDVLCGAHRRARASLGIQDDDDDAFNLGIAIDTHIARSKPVPKRSPLAVVLLILIGIGFAIATAMLSTRHNVSITVQMASLLATLACFIAAVMKAFRT